MLKFTFALRDKPGDPLDFVILSLFIRYAGVYLDDNNLTRNGFFDLFGEPIKGAYNFAPQEPGNYKNNRRYFYRIQHQSIQSRVSKTRYGLTRSDFDHGDAEFCFIIFAVC